MPLLEEIKDPWWSLSILEPFAVVQGIEDVRQCIDTILKTVPGEVPARPTFGSNIYKYLDEPVNIAGPNIVREIVNALGNWEKRIEVTSVTYEPGDEGQKITFSISWKLISSDEINIQEIQF